MAWKPYNISLLVFCFTAISFTHAQQPQPLQMASLKPTQQLLWQRVSPSAQKPEGPVLYQLLFSASGTPGTLAEFDTNPRHLRNSDITDNGGIVAIGSSGLTINAGTGIISFVNSQPLPGGPFLPLAGGTLTGALVGTLASFSGNITSTGGIFTGNGSGLTNVNAALLGGQAAGFYQARVSGSCPEGGSIISVNPNGTVVCGAPLYSPAVNVRTVLDSTASAGQWTSVTIGRDGFPIVSYEGVSSGNFNLSVVHCAALDCSSQGPATVLDSTANTGASTSVAIGNDGFPIISYNGNNGGFNLSVVHCTAVDCSSHGSVTALDSTVNAGAFTSVTIGNDGMPVISYTGRSAGNSNLSVVHCTAVDCSAHGPIVVLDGAAGAGQNTSVTIGSDGFPIVSYTGFNVNFNLSTVHCTAVDCSAHGSVNVLDSAANAGQGTSVTIGTDGLPLISYVGGNPNSNLSAVHCSTVDCSTHDPVTVLDTTPFAGGFTSVTIGTDGLPLISYLNGIGLGSKLDVVHCTAVDCSAHTARIVLDSTSAAGYFTSVTIGTDGLPIISYRGFASSFNLSTMHCANLQCAPPFVRRR